MAIITATITVDFIANYVGDHRVCWRIQGSGDPYDCSTIVNCVGGGAACQAIITADVNDTSCDGNIVFEGYVQSGCETEPSVNGRVTWSAMFTPVVTCLRQELLCLFGDILDIDVADAGFEYILADTVVITRDPLDNQVSDGAISIAQVGDGVILAVNPLLNQGINYTVNDVLDIIDGIGPGAGAQITVNTIGGSGEITSFTLTSPGTDYVGNLSLTGGTGTGAILDTVSYKVFGAILDLSIDVPGSYEIPPLIRITTATGLEFSATIVLDPCPTYVNIGDDCNSTAIDITNPIDVGSVFAVCSTSVFAPFDRFVVNQTGCCVAEDSDSDVCFDYTFTNTNVANISIDTTSCGGDYQLVVVPASSNVTVCLVEDGFADPGLDTLSVIKGAACS